MVDTSKRSDAAAAPSKATAAPTKPKPKPKPAADLDACFRTMTLEDPTSVRRPQPQPKPEPLQAPVPPTSRADALQQFEMVRQHWPQPPSDAAKYASVLGSRSPSSFLASHFGACSPRFNALAATFSPSTPSSSTNQPAWDHYLGGLNPFASAPTPVGLGHNAASLINHHPYAGSAAVPATASFAQHDNADPYASAFLMSQLRANNSQVDCYHQPMAPAVPRVPTLAEVRSRLLRGPMDPALVASSPQTAAHVVRLLQEGGEEARRSVLAGVVGAVHGVMDSREARDVFRMLLGACAVRVDELRGIVLAVCAGRDVLMGILKHDHGYETSSFLSNST